MKVAMVTPLPEASGMTPAISAVGVYASDLLGNLRHVAPDLSIYCISQTVGGPVRVEAGVHRVINPAQGKFRRSILQDVRQYRPDIVHFQHELFMYGGILNAVSVPGLFRKLRTLGHRVAVTIHGVIPMSDLTSQFVAANNVRVPVPLVRLIYRGLVRAIVKQADAVIVHEPYLRRVLIEDYSCLSTPIEVIHLALPKQSAALRVSRDAYTTTAAATHRVLTFLGYLAGYKGLDVLLRAMPMINAAYPDVRLRVAGTVPARLRGSDEEHRIISDLHRLAGDSAVEFLGFIPDEALADFFSMSDLMVFPYTTAMSTSHAMALALGAGLPLLASAPFQNVLGPGSFYFDLTPEDLASKIIAFFSDASLRNKIELELKDLAASRSPASAALKTVNLYESLAARPAVSQ